MDAEARKELLVRMVGLAFVALLSGQIVAGRSDIETFLLPIPMV